MLKEGMPKPHTGLNKLIQDARDKHHAQLDARTLRTETVLGKRNTGETIFQRMTREAKEKNLRPSA
jgi:hypothetical protein